MTTITTFDSLRHNPQPKFNTQGSKLQQFKKPEMPNENRNYILVDENKVDFYLKQREKALPQLENILQKSNSEAVNDALVVHGLSIGCKAEFTYSGYFPWSGPLPSVPRW